MISPRLRQLYRAVPDMECHVGCLDCCLGYAPSMAKEEWMEIKHPGKFPTGKFIERCPFLGEKGCEIYNKRPFICRLFGTDDFPGCPHGCKPERPLEGEGGMRLLGQYEQWLWEDACRTIQKFIQWQKIKQAGDVTPGHFLWIRYLLSTRDGRKGLDFVMGLVDPEEIEAAKEKITAKLQPCIETELGCTEAEWTGSK